MHVQVVSIGKYSEKKKKGIGETWKLSGSTQRKNS